MNGLLLCEANISEGRDTRLVRQVAGAVRATPGVKLIHCSSDPDHHRSLICFAGPPEEVLAAAEAMTRQALELIDMSRHHGVHPRLGAVDVVPFVPLAGLLMAEAVGIAHRFGRRVGELGVPVYFYEQAATRPERRRLPDIRRGEYEGLAARLADPAWVPDEGPAEFRPSSGAVIAGARGPLVRFNVNLNTTDLGVARDIARAVRESSGGLPHVRALGVSLRRRGLVQIPINLTDHTRTPLEVLLTAVRREAAARGVEIADTELVGPVPLAALAGVIRDSLHLRAFSPDLILEAALLELGEPADTVSVSSADSTVGPGARSST